MNALQVVKSGGQKDVKETEKALIPLHWYWAWHAQHQLSIIEHHICTHMKHCPILGSVSARRVTATNALQVVKCGGQKDVKETEKALIPLHWYWAWHAQHQLSIIEHHICTHMKHCPILGSVRARRECFAGGEIWWTEGC